MKTAEVIKTQQLMTVFDVCSKHPECKNSLQCPLCKHPVSVVYLHLPEKAFFRHQKGSTPACPNRAKEAQFFGATATPDSEKKEAVEKFIVKYKSPYIYDKVKSIIPFLSYAELNTCIKKARKQGTFGNKALRYEDIPYVLTTYMIFKKGEGYQNARKDYYYRCYFWRDIETHEMVLYRQKSEEKNFERFDTDTKPYPLDGSWLEEALKER